MPIKLTYSNNNSSLTATITTRTGIIAANDNHQDNQAMRRYSGRQRDRVNYQVDSSSDDSDADDATTTSIAPKPKQLLRSFASHTSSDLVKFLREECADDFAALPPISDFTFENWTGKPSHLRLKLATDKRISIGVLVSEYGAKREFVHLYLGSNDSEGKNFYTNDPETKSVNRIGLTRGPDNKEVHLKLSHVVEPAKPFYYLCEYGRFFSEAEDRMLRAFACYIFLAAGHVEKVHHYRDFLEDLQDACAWVAQGRNADSKSVTDPAIPAAEISEQVVTAVNSTATEKSAKSSWINPTISSLIKESTAMGPSIAGGENEDVHELQPLAKKIKLDNAVSRMRRRHQEQEDDITELTNEVATLRRKADSYSELGRTIQDREHKIGNLEEQLRTTTAEKDAFESQLKQVASLKDKIIVAQKAMEGEREKREKAERKLKEYVDAQKMMAAKFAGLEG